MLAAATGLAFVEMSAQEFGEGGWKIWFLPTSASEPIELDRGLAPGAGAAPTIAMDSKRIAWAAFDEPSSGPVSLLRMVSINDLASVTTLISHATDDGLLWFPAINGDELWYAVIHADVDGKGAGDEFHLEWMTLSEPSATPTRFAGTGNDFNPAVNGAFIVWKTAEGDSAALDWGTLRVLDRQAGTVATIPVPNADRPSIGDKYVTFDEITHRRLVVFDPASGELRDLLPADQQGSISVGGQSLSGHLLAFYTQDQGSPRIGWAILPD